MANNLPRETQMRGPALLGGPNRYAHGSSARWRQSWGGQDIGNQFKSGFRLVGVSVVGSPLAGVVASTA